MHKEPNKSAPLAVLPAPEGRFTKWRGNLLLARPPAGRSSDYVQLEVTALPRVEQACVAATRWKGGGLCG